MKLKQIMTIMCNIKSAKGDPKPSSSKIRDFWPSNVKI